MSVALQRLRHFTAGPGRERGFTLIEVLAVCAIGILLAGLAWPSYRGQWLRAGRSEAMQALDHLQAAQERHREMFGRYVLALVPTGAESYRAEAVVRTGGAQDGDRQCHALTIDVRQGFTTQGPDGKCWNR